MKGLEGVQSVGEALFLQQNPTLGKLYIHCTPNVSIVYHKHEEGWRTPQNEVPRTENVVAGPKKLREEGGASHSTVTMEEDAAAVQCIKKWDTERLRELIAQYEMKGRLVTAATLNMLLDEGELSITPVSQADMGLFVPMLALCVAATDVSNAGGVAPYSANELKLRAETKCTEELVPLWRKVKSECETLGLDMYARQDDEFAVMLKHTSDFSIGFQAAVEAFEDLPITSHAASSRKSNGVRESHEGRSTEHLSVRAAIVEERSEWCKQLQEAYEAEGPEGLLATVPGLFDTTARRLESLIKSQYEYVRIRYGNTYLFVGAKGRFEKQMALLEEAVSGAASVRERYAASLGSCSDPDAELSAAMKEADEARRDIKKLDRAIAALERVD